MAFLGVLPNRCATGQPALWQGAVHEPIMSPIQLPMISGSFEPRKISAIVAGETCPMVVAYVVMAYIVMAAKISAISAGDAP